MTRDQEKKIIALTANWSSEFLLKKIDEIIVKSPIKCMLKKKISSSLLEEMDVYSDKLKNNTVLHGELDDLEKIIYAKKIIKENKCQIMRASTIIYNEIMSELNEIEDDFKWKETKQGRLILDIEEWIEIAKQSIPDKAKETILIGRNIADDNPCNIIVGGYSKDMNNAEIKKYVMSLNPPVKPLFIFPQENAN